MLSIRIFINENQLQIPKKRFAVTMSWRTTDDVCFTVNRRWVFENRCNLKKVFRWLYFCLTLSSKLPVCSCQKFCRHHYDLRRNASARSWLQRLRPVRCVQHQFTTASTSHMRVKCSSPTASLQHTFLQKISDVLTRLQRKTAINSTRTVCQYYWF